MSHESRLFIRLANVYCEKNRMNKKPVFFLQRGVCKG